MRFANLNTVLSAFVSNGCDHAIWSVPLARTAAVILLASVWAKVFFNAIPVAEYLVFRRWVDLPGYSHRLIVYHRKSVWLQQQFVYIPADLQVSVFDV